MFRRSFNSFLENAPSKPELYPYIYSISLKGLESVAKKKVTTEPVKCSQCGAILTNIKLVQYDKKIGTYFKCEYCNTINVIEKESIGESLPDDIDFIIEDIPPKETQEETITKVSVTKGELYFSIIDISGSMSGAKIESVKKSLVQTIKDFKVNSPITKYILIAFESSVYYYLRHDQTPKKFSGDLLFNSAGMKIELQNYLKSAELGSIGEFADGWVKTVENLRSMDMTALGPALFFGIVSFELFNSPGGRITLLTDGLANQGIGNLSGTGVSPEKFYEQMADLCNQNKIIVDVVGVSVQGDNNEMGLQILGKLTDKTGGKLYLISSQEMEAIFSELMQTNYIGKDVKVKIIAPTNITIKNITGAYSSKGTVKESELNLGAITSERELFVELDSPKKVKEKTMEEIPVQLQVEFKDKDGRKRLRVINDRVKITRDENEFKANYDQKLNAMMNIQAAGTEYYAGKAGASKERLQILKENILNEMTSLKKNMKGKFEEKAFSEGVNFLADELEEIDADEQNVQNAPAQSFMAAKGQSRARMSQEEKKMKMEKKK